MNALRLVTSDQHDIERIRQGDHAAFEAVFRAYYAKLCVFAYRYLRSPALAEEAVHDVFAKIWQGRADLRVHDSLNAYLYAAVRHRALSLLRRQGLEREWHANTAKEQLSAPRYGQNDAPSRLERERIVVAIEQVLADLPARCRTAMLLRWQREMSYAEIADVMQISVKTVEVHLGRAMKALRARLPTLLPDLEAD